MLLALHLDVAEAPMAVDQVGVIGVLADAAAQEGHKALLHVDDEGMVGSGLLDAVGEEIGVVVGLADLVTIRFAGLGAAADAPGQAVPVHQIQMDIAGFLAGVDDEIELLSGQFKAAGRAELRNGIAGSNAIVLFEKIHTDTSQIILFSL